MEEACWRKASRQAGDTATVCSQKFIYTAATDTTAIAILDKKGHNVYWVYRPSTLSQKLYSRCLPSSFNLSRTGAYSASLHFQLHMTFSGEPDGSPPYRLRPFTLFEEHKKACFLPEPLRLLSSTTTHTFDIHELCPSLCSRYLNYYPEHPAIYANY